MHIDIYSLAHGRLLNKGYNCNVPSESGGNPCLLQNLQNKDFQFCYTLFIYVCVVWHNYSWCIYLLQTAWEATGLALEWSCNGDHFLAVIIEYTDGERAQRATALSC